MVFMVSSMLSGACATPEFLMYMNYFIGNEYGKDYWQHPDQQADLSLKKRTSIISRASSVSSTSPMVHSQIGRVSLGCRSVS